MTEAPDFRGSDPKDPNVRAAMGAAVDQARQDFIRMLDELVAAARKNVTAGDILAMPSTTLVIQRTLAKMLPDPDDQLWYATNMLAEAALKLAFPEPPIELPAVHK